HLCSGFSSNWNVIKKERREIETEALNTVRPEFFFFPKVEEEQNDREIRQPIDRRAGILKKESWDVREMINHRKPLAMISPADFFELKVKCPIAESLLQIIEIEKRSADRKDRESHCRD